MTKLKIAIIGCKNMGRKHLRILRENFADKAELAGILNSQPQSTMAAAEELNVKAFGSLDEITLQTVDAAIVATPAESHYDIAKVLLQRKIPLLVEKPFTIKTENSLELKQLAEQTNTPVLVGHLENYNPAVEAMLKDVCRPVKSIEAIRTSCNPGFKKAHIVSELMIHDLAIVKALTDDTPIDEKISKKPCYRWDEQAVVELDYAQGTKVRLEAVRADVAVERKMTVIDGADNVYEIQFQKRQLLKNGQELTSGGDSLVFELDDFLNMVASGKTPKVSLDDACQNVALCNRLEALSQP